ncbi:RNA-binding motif, single-stranded-interacting protein 2-like [Python bivittatus]|uniref:RNA-binding motif, single-stranded-interacting protein 2-like n=1 Tax=Python bivittatus TaxID=176946 RepID=A0A9F5IVI8_PYTBI|nr:RNA-binding motif, single-stranded-interacting protein 2-like [Python bivittatus]
MRDSARGEGGGGRAGGGVEPASGRSRDPSQQPGRERRFPAVASLNRAPAKLPPKLIPGRRGSSGLGWAMIFPNSSSNSAGGSRTPYRKQQPIVPAHPMAPPSPSITSSNNNSSSSSSNSGWDQLSKTNLYIRGLPPNTTDQDLVKLCQP